MKSFALLFAVCVALLVSSAAADGGGTSANPNDNEWMTNYSAALERAKAGQKLVLLDFTGSDWCVWCKRLHEEIIDQKPFQDYARDQLVLVTIDFPRHRLQDPVEKKQNAALAEKFGIDGYPTIVVLDPDGNELGRTGYMEGGAKTFVRELKRFAARAAAQSSSTTK